LRHLVLLTTLASGLALPIVMLLSPRWNCALLQSFSSTPWSDTNSASVTNGMTRQAASFADPQSAGAAQPSSSARQVLAEVLILPLLWAIGLLGIISWLVVGRVRLDRIAAISWPLDETDWSRILEQERNRAGIARPVLLFSSS